MPDGVVAQGDRVQGASHFEVPETAAISLMDELRRNLPGFLVPQLVREIAGEAHKIPITPPFSPAVSKDVTAL